MRRRSDRILYRLSLTNRSQCGSRSWRDLTGRSRDEDSPEDPGRRAERSHGPITKRSQMPEANSPRAERSQRPRGSAGSEERGLTKRSQNPGPFGLVRLGVDSWSRRPKPIELSRPNEPTAVSEPQGNLTKRTHLSRAPVRRRSESPRPRGGGRPRRPRRR
jgi:hypothetical protein